MKKVFKFLLLIALPLLFAACDKGKNAPEEAVSIIGEWICYEVECTFYENNVVVEKGSETGNGHWVNLEADGTFTSDGYTFPSIGTWKYLESQGTLALTSREYGAEIYPVVSLTADELILNYTYEYYDSYSYSSEPVLCKEVYLIKYYR